MMDTRKIYKAEIAREDTNKVKSYIGLTGGAFKKRWYGHRSDIRSYDKDNPSHGTSLSRHVGKLKAEKIPHSIKWSIVQRAPTFNSTSNFCRLCVLEKYYIIFQPESASLNDNHELFKACLHRRGELLKNEKRRQIGN